MNGSLFFPLWHLCVQSVKAHGRETKASSISYSLTMYNTMTHKHTHTEYHLSSFSFSLSVSGVKLMVLPDFQTAHTQTHTHARPPACVWMCAYHHLCCLSTWPSASWCVLESRTREDTERARECEGVKQQSDNKEEEKWSQRGGQLNGWIENVSGSKGNNWEMQWQEMNRKSGIYWKNCSLRFHLFFYYSKNIKEAI